MTRGFIKVQCGCFVNKFLITIRLTCNPGPTIIKSGMIQEDVSLPFVPDGEVLRHIFHRTEAGNSPDKERIRRPARGTPCKPEECRGSAHRQLERVDQVNQIILERNTHLDHKGKHQCTADLLFDLFLFRCYVYVKLTTDLHNCLLKSKLVKREVSHKVILPIMK